jgi:diguanylate cyclase (GGDEF)-like protein
MSSPKELFEKKLYESRLNYLKNLPAKISEITLIWNQLNKHEWRNEVLLKMLGLAHNLAGAGGTFGFPKLSEQAKLLELALSEIKDLNQTPDNNIIYKIQDLLFELQKVELATISEIPDIPVPLKLTDVIYILDLDVEASTVLSRSLMSYGCSVKIINEVSDLEANLRNASPLIVLIDAGFADLMLDKYNVIQSIRKTWLITCPIVCMSIIDDFDARIKAVKSTASAFFSKPVDVSLLIERIHILTNAGIVESYRILIVEDDIELANYYALVLKKVGMEVFIETNPEFVLSRILEINPELIVMDLYMPTYNGIDLIKIIRQHQALFTLPIVLLTAEKNVDLQFLAREEGVDDFLQKPITEMHLLDAVLNRVQRSRYMSLSMTKDSLTGLFVHKKINEFLDTHLNIAKRYNHPLSYAIIDLDNFKQINDTYGHLTGDYVLVSLANLLKTSLRSTDFIGRYGGEEFAIIATYTDAAAAFESLDRIRNEFAKLNHYSGDQVFNVTFSAGVACYPKYTNLDDLMAVADKALYESKKNGRNQITIG